VRNAGDLTLKEISFSWERQFLFTKQKAAAWSVFDVHCCSHRV
jgi:hypothetical protein